MKCNILKQSVSLFVKANLMVFTFLTDELSYPRRRYLNSLGKAQDLDTIFLVCLDNLQKFIFMSLSDKILAKIPPGNFHKVQVSLNLLLK